MDYNIFHPTEDDIMNLIDRTDKKNLKNNRLIRDKKFGGEKEKPCPFEEQGILISDDNTKEDIKKIQNWDRWIRLFPEQNKLLKDCKAWMKKFNKTFPEYQDLSNGKKKDVE